MIEHNSGIVPAGVRSAVSRAGVGLVLVLLVGLCVLTVPHFASINNVRNIFTQITINTILASGMTFVIVSGGIDLSVGAVMAVSGIVCGTIVAGGVENPPILLGILSGVAVGCLFGAFNSFISERWRLPTFIVSLGTLNIARGAALTIADGRTIYNFPMGFIRFGSGSIFSILPTIFIVAIIIVILGQAVLSMTVFGRLLLAIGTNENAVRISGHPTSRYKMLAFVISGFCAGIAGVVYSARLTVVNPTMGAGFELNAIAAVIIGGASFEGGKGSLVGTLFGASIMGVLTNALILLGVTDFTRQIVTGSVIILAVILDSYRKGFARD